MDFFKDLGAFFNDIFGTGAKGAQGWKSTVKDARSEAGPAAKASDAMGGMLTGAPLRKRKGTAGQKTAAMPGTVTEADSMLPSAGRRMRGDARTLSRDEVPAPQRGGYYATEPFRMVGGNMPSPRGRFLKQPGVKLTEPDAQDRPLPPTV